MKEGDPRPVVVERTIPREHIFRHMLRRGEVFPAASTFAVIPASEEPPIYSGEFYPANIGAEEDPRLLELRFEQISSETAIALLMTNERYPRDLTMMAELLRDGIAKRGIIFDAVVGVEAMGAKISQEMARQMGPETITTTLQKGKPQLDAEGVLFVGEPKPWIDAEDGVDVSSGTSNANSQQKLFLDHKIAQVLRRAGIFSHGVAIVDDARLTKGTVTAAIKLLQKFDIPIAAVATVLNEAEPTDVIPTEKGDIPYVYLTKLPLFQSVPGGMQPIPETFAGLDAFYLEKS